MMGHPASQRIDAILKILSAKDVEIALAAPTGRAGPALERRLAEPSLYQVQPRDPTIERSSFSESSPTGS